MTTLFDPIRMGAWHLPNRILMAPLTRCRASEGRVPNSLMAEYYRQRAAAGLIISEATSISPMGVGYPDTPGIWSEDQVAGWKLVTQAVHDAGGRILLQLWHVGRISDPSYLNGELPVAPSAIAPKGHPSLIRPERPFVTPRALDRTEIPGIIEEYRRAAENAQRAGFDGVELHGANGYLLDQFLQDSANHRTDDYGGPIENRARLMLEAVDAAISIWGAFGFVAREMGRRQIAFICARESLQPPRIGPEIKKLFGGAFVANQEFSLEDGKRVLTDGEADAVAWGKLFIANPDLPARFAQSAPLNQPDPATFYASGPHGYTDYPFLGS
jgi:2,4-dienoyl-CoA reductase-like NADH-dependent reductase (Old Yellow Enzyme family)